MELIEKSSAEEQKRLTELRILSSRYRLSEDKSETYYSILLKFHEWYWRLLKWTANIQCSGDVQSGYEIFCMATVEGDERRSSGTEMLAWILADRWRV